MSRIYIIDGGGCQAIVDTIGNELISEVTMYQCKNAANYECIFPGTYVVKYACEEHAQMWNLRMNADIKKVKHG